MSFETPPTSSIALEVGYTGDSHFARVFRRIVDVTLTEFPPSKIFYSKTATG